MYCMHVRTYIPHFFACRWSHAILQEHGDESHAILDECGDEAHHSGRFFPR